MTDNNALSIITFEGQAASRIGEKSGKWSSFAWCQKGEVHNLDSLSVSSTLHFYLSLYLSLLLFSAFMGNTDYRCAWELHLFFIQNSLFGSMSAIWDEEWYGMIMIIVILHTDKVHTKGYNTEARSGYLSDLLVCGFRSSFLYMCSTITFSFHPSLISWIWDFNR